MCILSVVRFWSLYLYFELIWSLTNSEIITVEILEKMAQIFAFSDDYFVSIMNAYQRKTDEAT